MAWTACGILGILGGDYSRRRSPRPPTELANLSLENTENTCKQIVSATRDLVYRDQVELVIQPRMDKLQQVCKIYQAQKRSEIAADLSSLDNSAFRQTEKQLDSKMKITWTLNDTSIPHIPRHAPHEKLLTPKTFIINKNAEYTIRQSLRQPNSSFYDDTIRAQGSYK